MARLALAAQQDTDSDVDLYGQKYPPSQESLGPPRMGISSLQRTILTPQSRRIHAFGSPSASASPDPSPPPLSRLSKFSSWMLL